MGCVTPSIHEPIDRNHLGVTPDEKEKGFGNEPFEILALSLIHI